MSRIIKARIFRFDPAVDSGPRYQDYALPADEPLSVLVLLHSIQCELDASLGFRDYCCGLQMCRSCLMKIDHKQRFACITLVQPGDEVLVEPAEFPENHIRDLSTRFED